MLLDSMPISPRSWLGEPNGRKRNQAPLGIVTLESRVVPATSARPFNLDSSIAATTPEPYEILDATPDGRYVIFLTTSTNVVPNQSTNDKANTVDLFWRDLRTGDTKLISAKAGDNGVTSAVPVGGVTEAVISDDGSKVAWVTTAYAGDIDGINAFAQVDRGNASRDVFLWYGNESKNVLVSVALGDDGEDPIAAAGKFSEAFHPSISADGSFVAYVSNLNIGRVNNPASFFQDDDEFNGVNINAVLIFDQGDSTPDIFRVDTSSLSAAGLVPLPQPITYFISAIVPIFDENGNITDLNISYDAFGNVSTGATVDTYSIPDIFDTSARDLNGDGLLTLEDGVRIITRARGDYMSRDGRYFAFTSNIDPSVLTNYGYGTNPGGTNVFLIDGENLNRGIISNANPAIRIVSHVFGNPTSPAGDSFGAVMNGPAGQFVLYQSRIGSMVDTFVDNNTTGTDLFLASITDTAIINQLITKSAFGFASDTNLGSNGTLVGDIRDYSVSRDGKRVVFLSTGSDFTTTAGTVKNQIPFFDLNKAADVYVYDFFNLRGLPSPIVAASSTFDDAQTGNRASFRPRMSDDGRYVMFDTLATNVQAFVVDNNNATDIIIRDIDNGRRFLASANESLTKIGNGPSQAIFVGTSELINGVETLPTIIFLSKATNLIQNLQINPSPFPFNHPGNSFYSQLLFISPVINTAVAAYAGTSGEILVYGVGNDGILTIVSRTTPIVGFNGELRVATGDLNGDGTPDFYVAAGPGGGPRVTVVSGADGKVLRNFFAFEQSFRGGLYIAAGDINGDGFDDIIVGADEGGGPRIRIFDGRTNAVLGDFFAFEDSFRGGARVAVGDINKDGVLDLIIGAGMGGGPRVRVFSGADLTGRTVLADFFAFDIALRNGVYVSGGDVNGDGWDDIVVGAGPGGGPHVRAFDAKLLTDPLANTVSTIYDFFAFDVNSRSGVRPTVKRLDPDDLLDIVVGPGNPSTIDTNRIRTYRSAGASSFKEPQIIQDLLLPPDYGALNGVWVG